MQRKQKEKPCKECGKLFTPKSPNGKYCSSECARAAELRYYTTWKNDINGARRQIKDCVICGNPFLAASDNAKYCSAECRIVADKEASLRRHAQALERRKKEEEARRRPPLWNEKDGFSWAQILRCMKKYNCQYVRAVEILKQKKGD